MAKRKHNRMYMLGMENARLVVAERGLSWALNYYAEKHAYSKSHYLLLDDASIAYWQGHDDALKEMQEKE